MCYDVKWSEFIMFDFSVKTTVKENLNCSYNFKAQAPDDKSLPIRAIVVSFSGESEENTVHVRAECKVVFDIPDGSEIPAEDVFIQENYKTAYNEFCKKANDVFIALGQNRFDFQEIR